MSLDGYERYQLEWMIEHGHSIRELIDELGEIDLDGIGGVRGAFDAWERDRGFGGEVFASREEFTEDVLAGRHPGHQSFTIAGCTPDDVLELYEDRGFLRDEAVQVARKVNERMSSIDDLYSDVLWDEVCERDSRLRDAASLAALPLRFMSPSDADEVLMLACALTETSGRRTPGLGGRAQEDMLREMLAEFHGDFTREGADEQGRASLVGDALDRVVEHYPACASYIRKATAEIGAARALRVTVPCLPDDFYEVGHPRAVTAYLTETVVSDPQGNEHSVWADDEGELFALSLDGELARWPSDWEISRNDHYLVVVSDDRTNVGYVDCDFVSGDYVTDDGGRFDTLAEAKAHLLDSHAGASAAAAEIAAYLMDGGDLFCPADCRLVVSRWDDAEPSVDVYAPGKEALLELLPAAVLNAKSGGDDLVRPWDVTDMAGSALTPDRRCTDPALVADLASRIVAGGLAWTRGTVGTVAQCEAAIARGDMDDLFMAAGSGAPLPAKEERERTPAELSALAYDAASRSASGRREPSTPPRSV